MHGTGLGSSAFARHYLRSPYPFLEVLRCFSSLGSLHPAYRFSGGCRPITAGGLPHSGTLGSRPALRLPEAFRSAPRPSSACNAKASTSDASSLTALFAVSLLPHIRRPVAARPCRPTGGAGPRRVRTPTRQRHKKTPDPMASALCDSSIALVYLVKVRSGSPWTRTRGLCLIRAAL